MAKGSKSKTGKAFRSVVMVAVTVIFVILTTASICGIVFSVYVDKYINPYVDVNLDSFRMNFTSFIYYTDKKTGEAKELENLYVDENRVWVDLDGIPKNLQNAFIAIEDKRFWKHKGVDWQRSIGAMMNWVGTIREGFGGGSTITQQLIKNLTGDDQVTAKRKIQEIMRALNFEKDYNKKEILELYLNTIFLGRNCNGVKTAAQTYFGKDVKDLTLAECACLAGITKNPSYYDPFRFPEHNKERQKVILSSMLEQKLITKAEYDSAVAQKLVFKKAEAAAEVDKVQSYFVDQVITDVINDLVEKKSYSKDLATRLVYSGGLKIYTTIDVDVQKKLDSVFLNEQNFPGVKGKNGQLPQASMIIQDPYTGDVVAMYGGRGQKVASRTLNRATQTKRSPGSVIKPLGVYAPAIEYGLITPASVFDDAPKDFSFSQKGWPKNYYSGFKGRMTVEKAVEISNNTIPVEILKKLTPEKSFDFMYDKLSIKDLVDGRSVKNSKGKTVVETDKAYAPLALGGLTDGLTVLEVSSAYSSFANKGVYNKPRTYTKVLDSSGNVLIDNKQESHVAMKEKTADYIIELMKGVTTGRSGTGVRAKLSGFEVAAKTGTTTSDYDRWFVGITPYYTGAVWFGYDQQQTIKGVDGNPALVLWKDVMSKVHEDLAPKKFDNDESFVATSICLDSGLKPSEYCSMDVRGGRIEKILLAPEDVPKDVCDVHVPVQIDAKTNMRATEFCPKEDIKTISLLKLTRNLPVTLADDQYVLKDPVYADSSTGKSSLSAFNTYCTSHLEPIKPPEEVPVIPEDGNDGNTGDDNNQWFDPSKWPWNNNDQDNKNSDKPKHGNNDVNTDGEY